MSGSQPLTVTWYKDDSEIYASDKYDVSFKSNMVVLSVSDCTSSDGGVYTCLASNEAGKASCRVSLTISGMSVSLSSLFDIMYQKRADVLAPAFSLRSL